MATKRSGFPRLAAGVQASVLAGCAALSGCAPTQVPPQASSQSAPAISVIQRDTDSAASLSPATGADAGVAYPVTSPSNSPAAADLAGSATAFATRNALYEPVRFADLPGWSTDNVTDAWEAFRRSCTALGAKAGWAAPCVASRSVDAGNAAAVRRFFEENFAVYQIRNVDKSTRGVLTGYYEPTLNGSRKYRRPYVYPVYGVPRDMLFLDQRRLPSNTRNTAMAARIDNHTVIPLTTVSTGNLQGVYALELRDSVPDIRDKKLRLRLDGNRIVPYYSRAEIERGRLNAPVLAYVDDPAMLYSMQLQGAGKIRLPDGTILRLAYAEQNGFAFIPPVASAKSSGKKIRVRGVDMDIDVEEDTSGPDPASAGQAMASSTAGAKADPDMSSASTDANDDTPRSSLLRDAGTASPSGADNPDNAGNASADSGNGSDSGSGQPASPLLRGFNLVKSAQPAVHPARTSASAALAGNSSGSARTTSPAQAAAQSAQAPGMPSGNPALSGAPAINYLFATTDPSYVFFKPIPDSPTGPIGALGVPLSAGRSAAIDPRTTPLGAPVFVGVSNAPAGHVSINRLVMAQDAGGAIRGAVRADFFFGSGPQAQVQASTMKQPTEMWILLPKGLRIAAKETRIRVRGAPVEPPPDCVVSDPDLCVDDPR
jgi:membrane-bound lytic murein transglycosylase A